MGVSTVTATRILKGQLENHLGPETPLAMDRFPYTALSKVSLEAPGSPQGMAKADTGGRRRLGRMQTWSSGDKSQKV